MGGSTPRRKLTVYVQAEPGTSGPQFDQVDSPGLRVVSFFAPIRFVKTHPSEAYSLSKEDDLKIPYGQAHCVRLVYDIASRMDYDVEVVEITDPEQARKALEPIVGNGTLFPVLVRPDGSWIEGEESFTPDRVRKFLS